MKIVVLDGFTLNPGDISWERLHALGDVTIHDRTPADKIIERIGDAEIIFTNKTVLTDEIFAQLPQLKYVGVLATGYNVVDVESAKKHGIAVTNIPTYGTTSVAQMTFALILELCAHVQAHSTAVHNGDWTNCKDFCFWNYPMIELCGKTLGLVGFGRIGQETASLAYAFGMKVLAFDANPNSGYSHDNFAYASLDEVLASSDFVSLHCPLFPSTQGIINKDSLAKMKKSAFLINTSRGPLVDEQALADALNSGVIAGAALDVLTVEPPKSDNPVLTAKNCIITPHISWATKEARARLMDIAVDNLSAFIGGNAVNVVNK